ncbi:hypothetical protein [Streptomyces sp. NPDC058475]|uniref:hypothetical protein n=1 Tax=unclassified Streptomyces TaxID=2593676 RepID=UPI003649C216
MVYPSLSLSGPVTSGAAASVLPGLAAVVAPYGTGRHYVEEFVNRGWECVAVTPADDALPPLYRGAFDPTGYRRGVVVHDGSLEATATALRALRVTAVVAGTEIGVPLAEQLAHRLRLPGNNPATSAARRDKGAMARALAEAGIAGPRSLSTDRLQDALSWADSLDTTDVVLKPADSAGSDGVTFCSGAAEIRAAWDQLHQVRNAMGGSNEHLVLQERLSGSQYVVNSVSAMGPDGAPRHTATEFWSDRRTGSTHVYDRLDLMNPERMIPRVLAQYTVRVLDALGIVTGPAHTELMLVPGRGPLLIESGARPEGSYDPVAMREATGSDHIRDAVTAVVTGTPDRLAKRPRSFVSKVSLIAPHDGALDEDLLRTLLTLPTVRGYVGTLISGIAVQRTVDLLTSPGRLVLAAQDPRAIDEDHHAIRALESAGLYGGEAR